MPIYCYLCKNCPSKFEVYQDFHDKPKKVCPKCHKHSLYRNCSSVYAAIRKDPSTIEHIADRNTQKMGHYEYEHRLQENKGYQKKRKKVKPKTPFWREGPVKSELLTATSEEKKKYIEKGILPPNRIKETQEKIKEEKQRAKRKQS